MSTTTLSHMVEWTPFGLSHSTSVQFGNAKAALNWAVYQRKQLSSHVEIKRLENGQWVPDAISNDLLTQKVKSMQKDTKSAEALMPLGALIELLQKQAMKAVLSHEQKQEFVELCAAAFKALDINPQIIATAIARQYPVTLAPPPKPEVHSVPVPTRESSPPPLEKKGIFH